MGKLHLALVFLLVCPAFAQPQVTSPAPDVTANNNRRPAGTLENGVLTIRLEAAMGDWHPEEGEGAALRVAAFAEESGRLQAPGPLIRVPEGTEIRAWLRNRLPQPLVLHGMHPRPGDDKDTVTIPAGETAELRFVAGAPGTYFYWATSFGKTGLVGRVPEDSQLNGVLIIDPKRRGPGELAADERIMLISAWFSVDDDSLQPPRTREVLGINGLSWPHTERLTYTLGETAHWRVINATGFAHPMHLHGFFFRVDSIGDAERDQIYAPEERRMAVTELLNGGRTFSLTWTPQRAGNWVFHCHVLPHISPERRFWRTTTVHSHTVDHAREGMAGLVVGITVLPSPVKNAAVDVRTPRRRIELIASQLSGKFGQKPGMAFAIAGPGAQPSIPGPVLLLHQDEPTAIRVLNRLPEPLAVHWHGIELESYFDGVPGVSGSGSHLMPPIPPGKSFVAQMIPPRAGTFIYHSHIDDTRQLSSGLYGALIVLPVGASFDPEHDRVFVVGADSPGTDGGIWLNGSHAPAVGEMKKGETYRLRFINIMPTNPPVSLALKRNGNPVEWRPLAKDGADLPPAHQKLRRAEELVGVGETYDYEFQPNDSGELVLEVDRKAIVLIPEQTPSHKPVMLRAADRVESRIRVHP